MAAQQITTPSPRQRDPGTQRWLDRIYYIPDQFRSYEELQRARHRDLPLLSREELGREYYRCNHRLKLDDRPHPWLAGRLAAIRDELRRRGSRP